jgi:hypothetical protein
MAAPGNPTLARWLSEYADEEMVFASGRMSKKSRLYPDKDAVELHHYCGGILRNERSAPQRRTS